ncbi:MAG: segregation/condensation protein A [Acetobacteraceae bacterium]|nr:segregation/condensation protein A [Acetobacteraceae bacterium]
MSEQGLPSASGLIVRLEGFEGPLDLLLELARAQKVDLAKISILALVEQYLAVIEGARRVRLELAADWLVMAAWLTWLKSRLLVPAGSADSEAGEQAVEALTARLRDLQAIRAAAAWLQVRPQLRRDVFARGAPEDHTEIDRSRLVLELGGLARAYLQGVRRGAKVKLYRPRPLTLWTVQDALHRLGALLGSMPDWISIERFLPEPLLRPIERRAALASTLVAGLEMARGGALRLHQDRDFGPILVGRSGAAVE